MEEKKKRDAEVVQFLVPLYIYNVEKEGKKSSCFERKMFSFFLITFSQIVFHSEKNYEA